MGWLEAFAKLGDYFPSPPKPARKPDLKKRLIYTALALVVYYMLASTLAFPLVKFPNVPGLNLPQIVNIIFASTRGSIAQLGIGPLVTSGLIIQILAGAKIIDLDLTDPSDRKLFTQAEKGMAVIIAAVEGFGFAMYYRLNIFITLALFLQFMIGAFILIILDEAIQKGYGIGSGVSLFILGGVARRIIVDMFSPLKVQGTNEYFGFFPYIIQAIQNGTLDIERILYGKYLPGAGTLPSLTGLIAFIMLVSILVYLQQMKVNIPVTMQRLPGIKSRVPLQFLYVTNIPILLVGIVFSDLILFNNLASAYLIDKAPWLANALRTMVYYMAPPRTMLELIYAPVRIAVYSALLIGLSLLFGLMWIEVAGLGPEAQAENLVKSGLQMPGHRKSPKLLQNVLAKYIYPLTILSSLIVAVIALVGYIFNVYGSGMGILLAVGIVYQLYTQIAYERALETYPLLKRLIGEG